MLKPSFSDLSNLSRRELFRKINPGNRCTTSLPRGFYFNIHVIFPRLGKNSKNLTALRPLYKPCQGTKVDSFSEFAANDTLD